MKGGRNHIDNDIKRNINDYMKSISRISANRTIKIPGVDTKLQKRAVYHCEISFAEAYRSYVSMNGIKEISYSTFRKYIEKNYKKPHHDSDICKYCKKAKKNKKYISKIANEFGYKNKIQKENLHQKNNEYFEILCEDLNSKDLSEFFHKLKEKMREKTMNMKIINDLKEIENVLKEIANYEQYQWHKCISNGQRKIYNENIKDSILLEKALVFEIDFKQKIVNKIFRI
jgi:hypothetical protein